MVGAIVPFRSTNMSTASRTSSDGILATEHTRILIWSTHSVWSMVDGIKFHVPFLSRNEGAYIDEVFENGEFAGNGPFTKRCQSWLEDRFEVPHVLLTTSCTAALELSSMIHDIGTGDEVILPSYTFASTASAFLRNGATLVFAEIDPDTLMLDPEDVESRVTNRTKAVVPIHYAGRPADLHSIGRICEERDLILIEDAAQGLGSTCGGAWQGTVGSMGCISFHETKNIHCGLGGALFLNEPNLFDRAEDIWERGTNRSKMFKGLVDKYSWIEPGSSFYPAEIQAAFLLAQLEAMEENLSLRAPLTEAYLERLSVTADDGLLAIQTAADGERWNHHAVAIILPYVEDADLVRVTLREEDIHAYIGYVPLHSSPMGLSLGWSPEDLPVTEDVAQRVLRLPLHHEMTVQDVETVCSLIDSTLRA